jgi:hypothetical protein
MDKPANTFFAVAEHAVFGAEDPAAALRAVALVRRPAGADAREFLASYEEEQVPGLLDAARAPAWCLQNRAIRAGAAEPAFDAVTQIHAAADAGLARWAGALTAAGASVVLAIVSQHESALPDAAA